MAILGVYAMPDRDVVIGPDTPDDDLDRVAKCARGDFHVMAAIAEARAMRGQKLMFKSVRAS